jgi:hypothetical protein
VTIIISVIDMTAPTMVKVDAVVPAEEKPKGAQFADL